MTWVSMSTKASEVRFGESQERGILSRWADLSDYATGVAKWTKSAPCADYDFVGWSADHIPYIFVEIKARRSRWGTYGDVIFPLRKRKMAKRLSHFNIHLIGVTAYSCGTIVEVDLLDDPKEEKMITRHDRPNMPVRHCVYAGDSLRIYVP
jgi:hypothetical protein